MRCAAILGILLTLVVGGPLCVSVRAQEFPLTEADGDRVASLFDAPHPSDHAGLLGKVYMQQRYLQLTIDDPNIRVFDKSLQGFDSLINLPAMTLDCATPLDFDVFFGYSNAGLNGSASSGPITARLHAKSEVFTLGTSIYPTLSGRWRPFAQIGAQFSRADVDFVFTDPPDTFADHDVDHETDLLLNAGFECDLLDSLGYRMTVHAETSDRFRDSIVTNELILWPHERLFLRGGLATSLDNGGAGFSIGGGLAF